MAFDPAHWLPIAEECAAPLAGVDEQASYRTAVNRAYYSALMAVASKIGEAQGYEVVPAERTHSRILHALKDSRAGVLLRIREELLALGEYRNDADYKLECQPFAYDDVDEAIKKSQRLRNNRIARARQSLFQNLKIPS